MGCGERCSHLAQGGENGLAGRGLLHLAHLTFLDEQFARVGAKVAERLHPVQEAIDRLDTILGIGRYLAGR